MVARRRLRLPIAEYRVKGWNVFPLPLGVKGPPPKGVTGYNAQPITEADYRRWSGTYQNYAIVMPDGVVGIDIDVYKHGETALKVIGELPATIRSTSRDDGSGIYLYRVPPGTKLNGNIPGAGEAIQPFHRYGVVWPSVHPDGYEYLWLNGRDQEVAIPHIDDLPELPPAWIKRLQAPPRKRSTRGGRHSGKSYDGDVNDWLEALPKGALSPPVRATLRKAIRELRRYAVTGDCRYDSMVRNVGRLVGLGARRQRGVEEAIDDLFTEYTTVVESTRERDPENEYIRALEGAIAKWGAR